MNRRNTAKWVTQNHLSVSWTEEEGKELCQPASANLLFSFPYFTVVGTTGIADAGEFSSPGCMKWPSVDLRLAPSGDLTFWVLSLKSHFVSF